MKLKDRTAIITGSGLNVGESTAKLFSSEGARISVIDINENNGLRVAGEIKEMGQEAIFIRADVTSEEDVKNMVKTTIEAFGKIDILVNNVGDANLSRLTEYTEQEWKESINLNLTSAFICSKYVLEEMIKNKEGGNIINIASVSGLRGDYGFFSYSAAKAGMINLTRNIALDYSDCNIRANAICPGPICEKSGPKIEKRKFYRDPELVSKKYLESMVSGRLCLPEYVARAALFLASSDSEYINGTTLVVDGGLLAWSGLPRFTRLLK